MKLNRLVNYVAVMAALVTGMARAEELAIIPMPVDVKVTDGQRVTINQTTFVEADAACESIARYVMQNMPSHNNPALSARTSTIVLKVDPSLNIGDEGYELVAHDNKIEITGKTPAGVFYGVQTLRSLLPPESLSLNRAKDAQYTIPAVQIKDQPRFKWRGMMMDPARHFFNKDEVKNFIDILALHKLNRFHWHLGDNQGWRIEIKKYPKLTSVGAWRNGIDFDLDPKLSTAWNSEGKYGGFYTQDDIREVVAYAKDRFITVVPEIEMPGHSMAALRSYPEFSSRNKNGGPTDVYNPVDPKTKEFLENILTEVMDLFPGEFIHVGGDEVDKSYWRASPECQAYIKEHNLKDEDGLQADFIKHFDRFLASKGRRLIGWDEILQGGLAPGAAVMSWRGTSGGIKAALAGHDVVMSPGTHLYFDHPQERSGAPKSSGQSYLPLSLAYQFEPTLPDKLTEEQSRHILGLQANLWSEHIPNYAHLQFMACPRICATAEIGWSPAGPQQWDDFSRRVAVQMKRYDALSINYYKKALDLPPLLGFWNPKNILETGTVKEWTVDKIISRSGQVEVTFEYLDGKNAVTVESVAVLESGKEVARDNNPATMDTTATRSVHVLYLPTVTPGAKYVLRARLHSTGGTASRGQVSLQVKSH